MQKTGHSYFNQLASLNKHLIRAYISCSSMDWECARHFYLKTVLRFTDINNLNDTHCLRWKQYQIIKKRCRVCHKAHLIVIREQTAHYLRFFFHRITVIGIPYIWKTNDARLGRSLKSRYKTLEYKMTNLTTNFSVLTSQSIADPFFSINSSENIGLWMRTSMNIICDSTVSCSNKLRFESSGHYALVFNDELSKKVPDLLITPSMN